MMYHHSICRHNIWHLHPQLRKSYEQLIREAIPFHLEGMAEVGDPIPPATSRAITVDVHIPVAA